MFVKRKLRAARWTTGATDEERAAAAVARDDDPAALEQFEAESRSTASRPVEGQTSAVCPRP